MQGKASAAPTDVYDEIGENGILPVAVTWLQLLRRLCGAAFVY